MKAIIKSFDAYIEFKADDKINIEEEQLKFWLNRFCPNVEYGVEGTPQQYIYLFSGEEPIVEVEQNKSFLTGSFHKGDESFLAKYITQVFQKILVSYDIFYIPAACVGYQGTSVLFMGDFWQGKTSSAIKAAELMNGKVVSDNYIAVKEDMVIGHTRFISLRKENSFIKSNEDTLLIRNNRIFINNQYEGENYKICGICIPYISSGDNNFHYVSKEEAVWYLYQKFSRLLNGESVLFNGEMPSPIFNDMETSKKLLAIAKRWADNYPLLYASGTTTNISLEIKKIFDEEDKF